MAYRQWWQVFVVFVIATFVVDLTGRQVGQIFVVIFPRWQVLHIRSPTATEVRLQKREVEL
jgi:putative Ca2+/H+ antiporter (TMEM165/GDT1 family)